MEVILQAIKAFVRLIEDKLGFLESDIDKANQKAYAAQVSANRAQQTANDAIAMTEEARVTAEEARVTAEEALASTPDWDQNDETAPDYIKNKPFGKSFYLSTGEITDDYNSRSFRRCGNIEAIVTPYWSEGQTMIVIWNGVKYSLTIKRYMNKLYLGNLSLSYSSAENTGEPFMIYTDENTGHFFVGSDKSQVVTWEIKIPTDELHINKISEAYMPHSYSDTLKLKWVTYTLENTDTKFDSDSYDFSGHNDLTDRNFYLVKDCFFFYGEQNIKSIIASMVFKFTEPHESKENTWWEMVVPVSVCKVKSFRYINGDHAGYVVYNPIGYPAFILKKSSRTNGLGYEMYLLHNGNRKQVEYVKAIPVISSEIQSLFSLNLDNDKLPNPNALTFSGAVEGTYDGSAPMEIEIPEGGSGGETWELVSDITLEEDVITAELFSGDIGYKKLMVRAMIQKSTLNTETGSKALCIHPSSMNASNPLIKLGGAILLTDYREAIAFVELKPYAVSVFGSTLYDSASGTNANITYSTVCNVFEKPIKDLMVTGESWKYYLGTGTRIITYGVRV